MKGMPVMPRESEEWTVEDLDRIPDDGLQYELLDGMLLVTPAPVPLHQRVCARLFAALLPACPPGVELLFAPLDWRPDGRTSLQPDLLAFTPEAAGPLAVTGGLLLAVEVLSPSTRRKDLVLKYSRYQEAGVECYWVVDQEESSVVVHRLVEGRYVQVAQAVDDEVLVVDGPFGVRLRPGELVRPPGSAGSQDARDHQ